MCMCITTMTSIFYFNKECQFVRPCSSQPLKPRLCAVLAWVQVQATVDIDCVIS